MPRKTTTKPKRETWIDWQAEDAPDPGPLLTRDEFLQLLASEGIEATENDLLFWQRRGVIPYPEIRRLGRVGFSYYPFWMADLIRELRRLQAEGHTLAEISVLLRQHARIASTVEQYYDSPSKWALALPHRITPVAHHFARVYHDVMGVRITRVEVRLFDERGNPHDFNYSLGDNFDYTIKKDPDGLSPLPLFDRDAG